MLQLLIRALCCRIGHIEATLAQGIQRYHATPAAQLIYTGIIGNAIEPCFGAGAVTEPIKGAERAQQRLLGAILRVLTVAHHAQAQQINGTLILRRHRLKLLRAAARMKQTHAVTSFLAYGLLIIAEIYKKCE